MRHSGTFIVMYGHAPFAFNLDRKLANFPRKFNNGHQPHSPSREFLEALAERETF
jgi:hypothetical protein